MADTNLSQLVIHELTKAQYEALTPEANQLYLVTDETPIDSSNLVTSISASSTDSQVPTAKATYTSVSGKANKSTKVTTTMTASTWSSGTYSFEGTYPSASYNLELELAPTATSEQYKAYGKAGITGNASSNVVKALGTVPTVDIPVILTVEAK